MEGIKPFLTAEWRWLAMANYEIDPAVLLPHVPDGTEIDFWHGRTYVSLVGFLFLDTKVKGVSIPFHRDFEEVNLRFYVRRRVGDDCRRGVVFIKEIVPRHAIAAVARALYNERYVALPMRHVTEEDKVGYYWRYRDSWNELSVSRTGEPAPASPGSHEEFLTEHYWGYSHQRNGGCLEYRVEHVPWRIWQVERTTVQCSTAELYGREFAESVFAEASSVFLADGSAVAVYPGRRLENAG
jgi:uncharacterized protein YqjF (DUF2071 family)